MKNQNTKTIEIDLDVYKALVNLSTYVDEPFNDILRRELKVNAGHAPAQPVQAVAIINPKKGIVATGMAIPGGFKVFKGSTVCASIEPSFSDAYIALRNDLFKKGVINSKFEFTTDHIFTSSSTAASIIFGGSRSGNREWKS